MKINIRTYGIVEKWLIGFCLVLTSLVLGVSQLVADIEKNILVREDGIVETLTVVFLLVSAYLCLSRVRKITSVSRYYYAAASFILILVVGEEISWGQRIMNIQSPEFFLQHNAQRETNFHNLLFYGMKVNKLLFGAVLQFSVLTFLLATYYLNQKSDELNKLFQKYCIPHPEIQLIIGYMASTQLIILMEFGKKWEFMELVQSITLFLLLLKPVSLKSDKTH